ncbi:hypothetical protein [Methanohalophilus mahii]|uniref:Uncharacterized protein n=1 Tax=Methanohalophilus mahii (strain ATCC 35705 / DSM 5219 / SLP) TaxID=547558 RepID=D5E7L4_METMS|nr:hypothetical protein [Methanohalophilus mahii]ADE37152.1 hypothetical protein Mmah_1656 [Methanohalophilus mahii DSM 5219]
MNEFKNELQDRYYTEGFISNFLAIIIGIITRSDVVKSYDREIVNIMQTEKNLKQGGR